MQDRAENLYRIIGEVLFKRCPWVGQQQQHWVQALLRASAENGRWQVPCANQSSVFLHFYACCSSWEELFIAYLFHPRRSADRLIGCRGIFVCLFDCCGLFFKPVSNDCWECKAREGTALKSSLYIYLCGGLSACVHMILSQDRHQRAAHRPG